jgi:tetratricopeptide (TPR) repeat protein
MGKSTKIWEETLNLCKKQAYTAKHDLLAKCYNRLSTCWYAQNNLSRALYYVEEGLKQYRAEEQDEIKYALLVNKVLYLRKSDRRKEAVKLIKEVWPLINQIQSVKVKLILYKSYCDLLLENNELEEAVKFCKDSIEIAHRNVSQRNLLLDFLNILGNIYLRQRKYNQALEHFHLILELAPKQNTHEDMLKLILI